MQNGRENACAKIAHSENLTFKIEEAHFRAEIREFQAVFSKIPNSLKIRMLRTAAALSENRSKTPVCHCICFNPVISM